MTTATERTTQVYRIYIKAAPQAVWDAITKPEWAERYGYASRVEFELKPGGSFKGYANAAMKAHGVPEVAIVGEVIECDPPRTLVQTWHPVWDPQASAEAPTRLTYELVEEYGATRLTITHDVTGAPGIAMMVSGGVPNAGGGWAFVLSDLKTLLETGRSFGATIGE